MRRLTVPMIMSAPAFRNTLGEKELDLRGKKIPRIENLGATQDLFDVVDLSNNQIEVLDDFPKLLRLTTLFVHNNIVKEIGGNFGECLPNLHTLMLTNNNICDIQQLHPLISCKKLERLCLLLNPVTTRLNYRLNVIRMLPTVRYLDFQRILAKEREEANSGSFEQFIKT